MGSAKHMRNNGEEIKIHQHDNYQMPGAYKQMGDMNKNQPMKGYDHMNQPGKISGGAAKYISESYATPKITDPSKPENPTKEKLDADAKIKSNPEFDVNSPLPEGSSDIGGEVVGRGKKVMVTGNFDGRSMVRSNDLKSNIVNKENLLNAKNTGLYHQSEGAKERTKLITDLANSSPSNAKTMLSNAQKSEANKPYSGAGSDQAPEGYSRGDFAKENPSARNQNALYRDLSIESYQPKPKFKASGAPGLYKHNKK